jgi:rubrerythrin
VTPWNSIDEALTFAIGEEQAAADFYARLAQRANVPGMKQALLSFAQEEMSHKTKLEAIRAGGRFLSTPQEIADLKIADYVVNVTPDPDMSYRDALIVAMKKEKAAFRLYSDLAASAPDEALKKTFLGLAQEEAKHKLRFEVEFDDLLTEN